MNTHFLLIIWLACGMAYTETVNAEIVSVKYRGLVNLSPFKCEWITRTSDTKLLCYDSKEKYVIANLTGTYYHYCNVPSEVVTAWLLADPMNEYYNTQVRRHFDCRLSPAPSYEDEQ